MPVFTGTVVRIEWNHGWLQALAVKVLSFVISFWLDVFPHHPILVAMQKGGWVDGFSPRHAQENEFITMDGWFGNLDNVVALELSAFLAEDVKIQMLLIAILHASYP